MVIFCGSLNRPRAGMRRLAAAVTIRFLKALSEGR